MSFSVSEWVPPLFYEVTQTIIKKSMGTIDKATRVFSLKLGIDQKWMKSCKKVSHPNDILPRLFSLFETEKGYHFILICMLFTMFLTFHNFQVL